jgi:HPt (histidine-containing phosphotransfer) domain-containing protein
MAAVFRMSGLGLAGLDSAGSARRGGAGACPIDLVHLARQTMGDRALEVELLALFDGQAARIARQLGDCESGLAHAERADLAHKLKGSARAVGAHEVAAAAENYEHRARAGLLRAIDAETLTEAVARVRVALRELAD